MSIAMTGGNAEQQRQLPTEIGRLNDTATRISQAVENLESRLGLILRPSEQLEKESEDKEAVVPLAASIRTIREALESSCAMLEHVPERLEI